MAYSITYPWKGETTITNRSRSPRRFVPWLCLFGAVIGCRVLVQEFEIPWHTLFHPLTDHETIIAVRDLITQLTNGMPIAEAVTAFCTEIINNA